MAKPIDKRIRCPFCNAVTWMKDFVAFMRDHDRPQGGKCQRATKEYAPKPEKHTGTRETMPMHLWMDAVLREAGVSVEQAQPHRARLNLWANSGEPVWMAADGLKQLVRGAEIAKRVEADDPILHGAKR